MTVKRTYKLTKEQFDVATGRLVKGEIAKSPSAGINEAYSSRLAIMLTSH